MLRDPILSVRSTALHRDFDGGIANIGQHMSLWVKELDSLYVRACVYGVCGVRVRAYVRACVYGVRGVRACVRTCVCVCACAYAFRGSEEQ